MRCRKRTKHGSLMSLRRYTQHNYSPLSQLFNLFQGEILQVGCNFSVEFESATSLVWCVVSVFEHRQVGPCVSHIFFIRCTTENITYRIMNNFVFSVSVNLQRQMKRFAREVCIIQLKNIHTQKPCTCIGKTLMRSCKRPLKNIVTVSVT